jgi:hypothetical protein
MTSRARIFRRAAATALPALIALAATPSRAGPCDFEPQGEGHVSEVISGKGFRLADGREISLAGIEPVSSDATRAGRAAMLSAIVLDKDVRLHGEDDTPDRYGRQAAFVFLGDSDMPVQSRLLADGAALVSTEVTDKDCATVLTAAEAAARAREKGHLGQSCCHKKRGKCRRYFGRDWAICACRGQGFVRTTGWGNDLPELRATLDTGLRCDYFEAHAAGG